MSLGWCRPHSGRWGAVTRSTRGAVSRLGSRTSVTTSCLRKLLSVISCRNSVRVNIHGGHPAIRVITSSSASVGRLVKHGNRIISTLRRLAQLTMRRGANRQSRLVISISNCLGHGHRHLRSLTLSTVSRTHRANRPISLGPVGSFRHGVVRSIIHRRNVGSQSRNRRPRHCIAICIGTSTISSTSRVSRT